MALNLAFETMGSGPPLLVLHGLFGSSGNWRSVARHLAATHTVHCVDLRNHGASPWADTMGYGDMADDLLQLMDRLALRAPVVIGHSMGGKAAMALALRQPQRVGQLVVVDIAPVSYADTLTPFALAMSGAEVMSTASLGEVQRRLQQAVPDPGVVPFLMQNLVRHNDHFDWRINLVGICAAMPQLCSFPPELLGATFEGPVTVIAGERSDYVPRHDGSAFGPMFPRAQVEVLPGAGHWVHADQPAAFVALLKRVLKPQATVRRASAHSTTP
jgi:esterase